MTASCTTNSDTVRRITLKSLREIETMREAGRIVATALDKAFGALEPGITTAELNDIALEAIVAEKAIPAFLGLYGFPGVACISLNDEIVHGIPDDRRVVKAGDLVSIDCGAIVDGYYSDCARTVIVGNCNDDGEKQRLIATCEKSLELAIQHCVAGNRIGDISHAVESHARSKGFELVREYVGHGVGRELHEPPSVPNVGTAGQGPLLMNGMTIAIEPMIMTGSYETKLLDDDWTVATADGSLSAHFEHTVAVTKDGPEILTVA